MIEFPMHVGMNRIAAAAGVFDPRVPHARGDEPSQGSSTTILTRSSPCTWG